MVAVARRTRSLHVPHRSVSNVLALQNRAAAHDLWIRHTVIPGDRLASRLAGRGRAQGKLSVADGESLRETGSGNEHCQ